MKSVIRSRQWSLYIIVVSVSLMIAGGAFAIASRVSAVGGYGDTGTPSGGGSGSGYRTSKGFGWKLFDVSSSGPSGGFDIGSWRDAQNTCAATGKNKVWVHVIRNSSGGSYGERSFSFTASSYNVNRPYAGGDPYKYDANGNPSAQQPIATVISIVEKIHGYYSEAGFPESSWGKSVGWFCWSNNPPWNITVTTSTNKTLVEVGDTVEWTHSIKNEGPSSTNRNVTWHYQNSGGWPHTGAPDWIFGAGNVKGAVNTQKSTYTVQPSDFGKKLCRSIYARPKDNATNDLAKSSEACVTVGKYPKVHVLGADLFAGRGPVSRADAGNIATSVSRTADGRYFGSWSEYGIAASGLVKGMASGSAYVGGAPTNALCSLSLLTFTNADKGICNTAGIGKYTIRTTAPLVGARLKVDTSTPRLSGSVNITDTNLQGIYTSTSNTLTLSSSGALAPGKWVAINAPNTTVTITSNLLYANAPLHNLGSIPQIVIIAKNIIIADSVSQVDAWLLAVGAGSDGRLNTCGAGAGISEDTPLTAKMCSMQLTVNGPVVANKLYLRRTFGADAARRGSAAEVFNLRADAYLWAAGYGAGDGRIPTAETKELPPRF